LNRPERVWEVDGLGGWSRGALNPFLPGGDRASASAGRSLDTERVEGGGEAEKGHQSAKQRGFVEFWTVYKVPDLDRAKAREKSPTTTRFYSLIELANPASDAFVDFRDRWIALVGIKAAPAVRKRK
jgi:hypothetical protein